MEKSCVIGVPIGAQLPLAVAYCPSGQAAQVGPATQIFWIARHCGSIDRQPGGRLASGSL